MTPDFQKIIAADETSRRDTILTTAARIGTPIQNVEKGLLALLDIGRAL